MYNIRRSLVIVVKLKVLAILIKEEGFSVP